MNAWGVGSHKPYATMGPVSRKQALERVRAQWYYDWSPTPAVYGPRTPACAGAGEIEAVPMIWGRGDIGKALGGNSEWLMGFNEPDSVSQAHLSLTEAAQLWKAVELRHPTRRLVSPTPSADNWGWREQWLAEYRRLYRRDPRIDAVATHIYPRTWDYFLQAMEAAWSFAERFGARLWVTEYAYLPCWPGGIAEAAAMVGRMTQHFLDHPERFERWAPFILSATGAEKWNFGTGCNTSLVDKRTGALTRIGATYAGMRPAEDWADPRADIIPDGEINILDLAFLAGQFGKKVEPET